MQTAPVGSQIIENLKIEVHVPSSVAHRLFSQLRRIISSHLGNGLDEYEHSLEVTPESALSGPPSDVSIHLLTRFVPLYRLVEQDSARRLGYTVPMLLHKPQRLKKLMTLTLGYPPRGIVWCSLAETIDNQTTGGITLGEILDRLGLRVRPGVDWVQMWYSAQDAPQPIRVPTTFDAGKNDGFRPSVAGARRGMTAPISSGATGFPEYVHGMCVVTDARIELRGKAA